MMTQSEARKSLFAYLNVANCLGITGSGFGRMYKTRACKSSFLIFMRSRGDKASVVVCEHFAYSCMMYELR
jgi:hypothetical protein